MKHKISIIVPAYNQEKFLGECLESVYHQTYENWECLIIDDGSTDGTSQVGKHWENKDQRFQYFYKKNGGLSSARNFGLSKIKGDFIQFLDSDDILKKEKLKKSIQLAEENNSQVIITNFQMLQKKEILPPFCDISLFEFNYENLLIYWDNPRKTFNFPPHTLLIKTELLDDLRFDETFRAKEDWLMWLEIFKKNPSVHFLNEYLVLYRMHPYNMTKDKKHMDIYTSLVHKHILRNLSSEYHFNLFFDRLIDNKDVILERQTEHIHYLENRLYKITHRPWYKKILYALLGKK